MKIDSRLHFSGESLDESPPDACSANRSPGYAGGSVSLVPQTLDRMETGSFVGRKQTENHTEENGE